MYEVIKYFEDLQDNNYPYHEGDTFPRGGKFVSEERLAELSSGANRRKKPLIKLVEEPVSIEVGKEKNYTKTEINRMSASDLKELAKVNGFDNADEMTGGELKKLLIAHFDL